MSKVCRVQMFRFDNDDPFRMMITIEHNEIMYRVRVHRVDQHGLPSLEANEIAQTHLQAIEIFNTWIMNNSHLVRL